MAAYQNTPPTEQPQTTPGRAATMRKDTVVFMAMVLASGILGLAFYAGASILLGG